MKFTKVNCYFCHSKEENFTPEKSMHIDDWAIRKQV